MSGHGSSALVASLSAAFGVGLLQLTDALAQAIREAGGARAESSATVALLLDTIALVFIVVAVYAGAVVITNTVATIVAGRVRRIALRRLLGSTARAERRRIAAEGLLIGLTGAALGLAAGTGFAVVVVAVAVQQHVLPDVAYRFTSPAVLIPMAGVVLTTWLAAAVGSRRVLTVSPVQALAGAEEPSEEEGAGRVRTVLAVLLVAVGTLLLAVGVLLGALTPDALLVAMSGGVVSFTGIVLGAHLVMPRVLRLVGHLFGTSPTARLARENAVRFPIRSTRSTVGLVVAVTLVMTFGVASETFGALLRQGAGDDPDYYAGIDRLVTATTTVFSALVGFSAVLAAIGLVNALSLGVVQRTRELGLLRAIGFSAAQLRRMVVAESGQLVIAAIGLGLALGTGYGWAGAESLLGSVRGVGLIVPSVPWPLVAVIVAGGTVLTLVASVAPARRATRIAPIEALGIE